MIPDYCEALTAYRCWNVHASGLLVGQAQHEPWPPYQPMIGRCGYCSNPNAHFRDGVFLAAPVLGCGCGVYALKTAAAVEGRLLEQIQQSLFGLPIGIFGDPGPSDGVVWGTVKLWGRIIEHEIGYRAAFAYPSALWCEDATLARTVAALYGVPCAVRTLPRPELDVDESLTYAHYVTLFTNGIGTAPPRGVLSMVPSPPVIAPTRGPTLSASRFQQQQAAKTARAAVSTVDWREMMKKAFHAP